MLKKFAKQVNIKKAVKGDCVVSSPFENKIEKPPFLSGFARRAISLYEKRADIKKFARLAISDPENLSHEDRIKEIFDKEQEDLFDLTNNEQFLKDLGLQHNIE